MTFRRPVNFKCAPLRVVAAWLGFSQVAFGQTPPEPSVRPPATAAGLSPPSPPTTSAASPSPTPSASPPTQGEYLHDGFYLRFQLGAAYEAVSVTAPLGPFTNSGAAGVALFAIGGTLPKGVVVAVASSALLWSHSSVDNYGVLG